MPGEKVNIVSPEGVTTSVDAAAVPGLQAQGWALETAGQEAARVTDEVLEEQYGGTGGALLAGAEGLVRGATFNLSDFVLDGRGAAMRRQVNPAAAMAGELGGAIAPALLSGGAGAAGVAARLTPRGLAAAKAAQWVAGATTRGARIGRAITAEALDASADLTLGYLARKSMERGDVKGEDLARQALVGALLGAAGGAVGGALARAPGRAAGEAAEEVPVPSGLAPEEAATARVARALDDAPLAPDLAPPRVPPAAPDVPPPPAKPPEIPKGFGLGPGLAAESPRYRGIPQHAEINEDGVYVLSARKLQDLGPAQLDTGVDPARAKSIREGWEKGVEQEPLQVTMWRDGSMEISQGRHRLMAAAEEGRDIPVRFFRGIEDVAEEAAPKSLPDWVSKYRRQDIRYVASSTGRNPGARRQAVDKIVRPGQAAEDALPPIDFGEFRRATPGEAAERLAASRARAATGEVSGEFAISPRPGRAFAKRLQEAVEVSTDQLAGKKAALRSWEAHQELMGEISSRAKRDVLREVDEVMQSPGVQLGLEAGEREILERALVQRARDVAAAAQAAKGWAGKYRRRFRGIAGPQTYQRALEKVPRALDEEGAVALAAWDEALEGFERELAQLRAAGSVAELAADAAQRPAVAAAATAEEAGARVRAVAEPLRPPPPAPEALPSPASAVELPGPEVSAPSAAAGAVGGLVRDIGEAGIRRQTARLGQAAESALGGGVIGKAVGMFIEAKAARGALGLVSSMMSGSPLARAVMAGAEYRQQIRKAIERGVKAARSKPGRSAIAKVPVTAAKVWTAADSARARQAALEAVAEVPSDLGAPALDQAERTIAYLEGKAPRNPQAGTPWARQWRPNPHAERDWTRRVKATIEPEWAIGRALSDPFAALEIEALRQVHPDLFAEVQQELAALTAPEIGKMRPAMRQALGVGFGVTLTLGQVPGYSLPAPMPQTAQPTPEFARPSTANASPLVQNEMMEMPR